MKRTSRLLFISARANKWEAYNTGVTEIEDAMRPTGVLLMKPPAVRGLLG